jgi:hypothetical protein
MQDHSITVEGTTSDGAQVIVHPQIVDWLRRALYAEIGSAAESLDTATCAHDREDHPERFRGPAQTLRESCALLDAIGWAKTDPPVTVPSDLNQDCWTLMRALDGALEFADEEVYEVSRDTDGQLLACERERVRELYDFMDDMRGHIDMLAVTQEDEALLDIAA